MNDVFAAILSAYASAASQPASPLANCPLFNGEATSQDKPYCRMNQLPGLPTDDTFAPTRQRIEHARIQLQAFAVGGAAAGTIGEAIADWLDGYSVALVPVTDRMHMRRSEPILLLIDGQDGKSNGVWSATLRYDVTINRN